MACRVLRHPARPSSPPSRARSADQSRTGGTPMASQDWFEKDFYAILGVPRRRRRRGDQEGLPQARAHAAPRRQARGRRGRAAVQGDRRGLRGPVRPRAAQAVRRDPLDEPRRRPVHRGRPGWCGRRGRLRGPLRRPVRPGPGPRRRPGQRPLHDVGRGRPARPRGPARHVRAGRGRCPPWRRLRWVRRTVRPATRRRRHGAHDPQLPPGGRRATRSRSASTAPG